jgi:hypothetical protein
VKTVTDSNGAVDPSKIVPLTAYQPEIVRRRVKVLAALTGRTMSSIIDEAFMTGFEMLEEAQKDQEEAQQEAS